MLSTKIRMLQLPQLLVLLAGFIVVDGQQSVGIIYNVFNAGQLNVYTHRRGEAQTTYSILTSTYDTGRDTFDNAYILYYPGQAMSTGFVGYGPRILYNLCYWAKAITQVPEDVFNFEAVAIPDGSTINGKAYGSVYITDISQVSFPATRDILDPRLPNRENFMYAGAVWLQGDAFFSYDLITCRTKIEGGVLMQAQLIFAEHPTLDPMANPWTIKVLKESACDSAVALTRLSTPGIGGNYDVVFATGYYLNRLAFFYSTSTLGYWTDPDDIIGVVIEQGRQFYDVKIVDINNDGKVDVLTTVVGRTDGSVEVWEIPEDFREGTQYINHVIAGGFEARNGGTGGRAPGIVTTFYPVTSNTQQKPSILLAGGDDGRVYVLTPTSQTSTDWDYDVKTVADYGLNQIVSGVAAADVDGDGYTELFVSVHNLNYVQVFSYNPASQN